MNNDKTFTSLFDSKEMFRMACTLTGKLLKFSRMTQSRRRKLT